MLLSSTLCHTNPDGILKDTAQTTDIDFATNIQNSVWMLLQREPKCLTMPWKTGEHVNTPLAIPGVYMPTATTATSKAHHLAPQMQ
jgi:hypothetical protein